MKITINFKGGDSFSTDKNVIHFKNKIIKDKEGLRLLAEHLGDGACISIHNGYDPSLAWIYPIREFESFEIEGAKQWV